MSVWFSVAAAGTTCFEVADNLHMSESEVISMNEAAATIVDTIRNMTANLPTSIKEDKAYLKRVRKCRELMTKGEAGRGAQEACPEDVDEWGHAIEVAVQFRIGLKRTLASASKRLSKECLDTSLPRGLELLFKQASPQRRKDVDDEL